LLPLQYVSTADSATPTAPIYHGIATPAVTPALTNAVYTADIKPIQKRADFERLWFVILCFLSFCFIAFVQGYYEFEYGTQLFCPPSSTAGNLSPAHRPSMQQTGSSTYSTCLPVRAEKGGNMKISFANSHDSIIPHYKLQKHAKTCKL
jgi:hypothetical protein